MYDNSQSVYLGPDSLWPGYNIQIHHQRHKNNLSVIIYSQNKYMFKHSSIHSAHYYIIMPINYIVTGIVVNGEVIMDKQHLTPFYIYIFHDEESFLF